ncbi:hypothetical protein EDC02_6352 [Micromonospora sp. Llam0]|uniref:hypothetical protein n=1 Tax=Micromonospora sp. Llam0 TaxID=2485143 RepID=UPI000F49E29E|nr:hypothetical protein [Micromonospora sp. Llam0]ROO51474.1 hypothetical protein EDC02_6352 [Micromonospora sp. Llam0]
MPTAVTTQSRHPWRATLRTAVAATIAALPLIPLAASEAGIDTVPAVAGVVAVTGAITRVMAIPGVDAWLRAYAPWLASAPRHEVPPGR